MPNTLTSYLGLTKPEIGGAEAEWGSLLNNDLDIIDSAFKNLKEFTNSGIASVRNVPGGGVYRQGPGTGAVRIKLPSLPTTSGQILSFWIDVVSLETSNAVTSSMSFHVTGYMLFTGGVSDWIHVKARQLGGDKAYPVSFGNDGVNRCISFGSINEIWHSLSVTIRDVMGNVGESWTQLINNDWLISLEASNIPTINSTVGNSDFTFLDTSTSQNFNTTQRTQGLTNLGFNALGRSLVAPASTVEAQTALGFSQFSRLLAPLNSRDDYKDQLRFGTHFELDIPTSVLSGQPSIYIGIPGITDGPPLRRFTASIRGLSTNGSSRYILRLVGNNLSPNNAGYVGSGDLQGTTVSVTAWPGNACVLYESAVSPSVALNGKLVIDLMSIGGANTEYSIDFQGFTSGASNSIWSFGYGTTSDFTQITSIQITTENGTDLFDAGRIYFKGEF